MTNKMQAYQIYARVETLSGEEMLHLFDIGLGQDIPITFEGTVIYRQYWLTPEQIEELHSLLVETPVTITAQMQADIVEAYLAGHADSPAEKESILEAYRHEPEYF